MGNIMRKKIKINLLFIFLLLMMGCTMAGAELGLIGTWEGDLEFSYNGYDYNDEITYIINSDDTGEYEVKTERKKDGVVETAEADSDIKILKADSINNTITIDYEDFDEEETYSYILSGNKLILYIELPDGEEEELELFRQ